MIFHYEAGVCFGSLISDILIPEAFREPETEIPDRVKLLRLRLKPRGTMLNVYQLGVQSVTEIVLTASRIIIWFFESAHFQTWLPLLFRLKHLRHLSIAGEPLPQKLRVSSSYTASGMYNRDCSEGDGFALNELIKGDTIDTIRRRS